MLAVRELGREDYAVRNQLVADSPQGNVFLHADWLQMLGDTDPDLRSLILGCFDDEGRLVGGQAVTYHQRWGMDISATTWRCPGSACSASDQGAKYARVERGVAHL
jgi:hypothetical protein